jgi:cell division septum initiation protein DivIVA
MAFNTFDSKNKVVGVLNELIAEQNRRAEVLATNNAKIVTASETLGTKGAVGFGKITDAARNTRDAIRLHADAIAGRISALTATLLGEATALINGYYDPIIAQDELRVLKDTVAADTIARNATKAGTAERHQADLTLANSRKNLEQTRLNLLASGQLTAKEQKAWLAELEKKYKSATGAAKADIGSLITKIHELQKVPTTVVKIIASITSKVAKAGGPNQVRDSGGPTAANMPYWIGLNRQPELMVPGAGHILTRAQAQTAVASVSGSGSGAPGGDHSITIHATGIAERDTPLRIANEVRRAQRVQRLTPDVRRVLRERR